MGIFLNQAGSTTGSSEVSASARPSSSHDHLEGFLTGRMLLTPSRWFTTLALLGVGSLAMALLALRLGAEPLSYQEVGSILWHTLFSSAVPEGMETDQVILIQVRLPRILLGFAVGGCLALAGVGLQALLRNPLADPYVLGISSGAALGAALATLLGLGTAFWSLSALPVCAMAGGLLSVGIVYAIAKHNHQLPTYSLLLAGVILNAIFTAMIMFITSIMDPNRSFGMMQWLMGSLTGPSYPVLLVLLIYLALGTWVLVRQAHALNILTLGDDTARSLGVNVEWVKKLVFFASALMTGAVVAFSGMIGFVGLVIPHAVRLVIGPDHRLLMPAAALVGGSYLLGADTLARTLLAPAEIPVGIITALVGGPLFMYLLVHKKSRVA